MVPLHLILHLNAVSSDFICYGAVACDEVLKISAPPRASLELRDAVAQTR